MLKYKSMFYERNFMNNLQRMIEETLVTINLLKETLLPNKEKELRNLRVNF